MVVFFVTYECVLGFVFVLVLQCGDLARKSLRLASTTTDPGDSLFPCGFYPQCHC